MATLLFMPRLSPTMEEGAIAKWLKQPGDKINPGDIVAEVETDKANMDFPVEEEGYLLKLLVDPGQPVKLGKPVAVLGQKGEDFADLAAQAENPGVATPAPAPIPAKEPTPQPQPATVQAAPPAVVSATVPLQTDPSGVPRVKASPLARRLALDLGIDLRNIQGSGPGGRIVKRDVETAPARNLAPAQTPDVLLPGDVLMPLSMMRRTVARRLVEAKQTVPHFYLTTDVDMEAALNLREQVNGALKTVGQDKVSVNDLILKALGWALRLTPNANRSISQDGQNLISHERIDLSVAVALEDGLITPVVRSADKKSLATLAAEVRDLAARARQKKLLPEEYQNGTFGLTNLGMFGIREFAAIVNPPESGILAVGRIEKRAQVVEQSGQNDTVQPRRMMTLTLSCDHRVIDGAIGAQLLSKVCDALKNPLLLLA